MLVANVAVSCMDACVAAVDNDEKTLLSLNIESLFSAAASISAVQVRTCQDSFLARKGGLDAFRFQAQIPYVRTFSTLITDWKLQLASLEAWTLDPQKCIAFALNDYSTAWVPAIVSAE